jgi:hypothetical protein
MLNNIALAVTVYNTYQYAETIYNGYLWVKSTYTTIKRIIPKSNRGNVEIGPSFVIEGKLEVPLIIEEYIPQS